MNRYVNQHAAPNGPGDARPTAEQVLKDDELIGKLNGKTILITGGTAGLGKESARALRLTGATVWITARNAEKAKQVVESISNDGTSNPPIRIIDMDLSDLDSVRRGAAVFLEQCSRLNVLMTNAGIMACLESRSAQNFELQFATNHLAHFLLFQLLRPALIAASTPTFKSRVISLSSAGHRRFNVVPENYNLENGEYQPFRAYGQSKTANILFANELNRRYSSQGIHAWSVHPGVIFETEISRHQDGGADGLLAALTKDYPHVKKIFKNTAQGAATQVWAAVSPTLEGKGGLYLEDVGVSEQKHVSDGWSPAFFGGHAEHIYDEQMEGRLWTDSLEMVGLPKEA